MDKTTEVHQTKKMLKAFKWIVFLLIIIVCMPPFSIRTENGSKKIHLSTEHKRDENKKKSTDSEDKNNKLSLNDSKPQEENLETDYKENSTKHSKDTNNITLNSTTSYSQTRIESRSNELDDKFQKPRPPEPPILPPGGIEIKDIVSNWNPIAWYLGGYAGASQCIVLDDTVYSVTANGDNLTLAQVEKFSPIDGYYYQKLWYQNESIICPAYTYDSFHHLAKIDLNNTNNITRYYFPTNNKLNKGQFFIINDAYYFFLSYDFDSNGLSHLYQLRLEESKRDTENGTITDIHEYVLNYSPIENTSIVVLNDTLYYIGYNNLGCCRLCAVKILSSQDESQDESQAQVENQVLIENIGLPNSFLLLETDNINRIWIIDKNGIIEYNTENERSKKISNKNDSYPDIYSSDSAVSFYSNNYLYLIVNNQAYMLYVGAYTEEKLFDMGFREKAYTYPQGIYKVFEYSGSDQDLKDKDFILVDNLQIVLDEHNNNNEVFSFVTACNKDTQTIWKQEVLKVISNLDQIGITSKEDFRTYYGEMQSPNVNSFSVLITTKEYSFKDWKAFRDKNILYRKNSIEAIPVPCLPFWCIDNLESNKIPEVQDASEWSKKYNNLAKEEIAQFTYLNKNGCGITKKFRLMFIIPNE